MSYTQLGELCWHSAYIRASVQQVAQSIILWFLPFLKGRGRGMAGDAEKKAKKLYASIQKNYTMISLVLLGVHVLVKLRKQLSLSLSL
eukprot:g1420.t1